MSRFAEGSIAGVSLVDGSLPVRIDLLDAEAFAGGAIASSVMALDLTVHTQIQATALSGLKFGVKCYQLAVSVRDAVVAAMESAMLTGDSFPVILGDDDAVDAIECMCVIDYGALNGRAFTRGSFSGAYVRDVTFRLIATGAIPEEP